MNRLTIKKYFVLAILIFLSACNKDKTNNQETKNYKKTQKVSKNQTNIYVENEKITDFYLPEKMQWKSIKEKSGNEKEDYQITLTNSYILDTDIYNLDGHSQNIAEIYYKKLTRIITPLNLKNIIVKIEHKNGKTDKFVFSEEDLNVK